MGLDDARIACFHEAVDDPTCSPAVYGFMTSLIIGVPGLSGVRLLPRPLRTEARNPRRRHRGDDRRRQRIGDAIDLLAQGYAKRLLISGVNEKTSREEISRLNPGQRRLFDCCVDLDYRARNTIGNAIETRRWAERNHFAALIVVTSNYHMPRTLVELNHALPNMQKIPYPVAATIDPHEWWHNPSTARVLFSEYVKFIAVWLRTQVEDDPEDLNRPDHGATCQAGHCRAVLTLSHLGCEVWRTCRYSRVRQVPSKLRLGHEEHLCPERDSRSRIGKYNRSLSA